MGDVCFQAGNKQKIIITGSNATLLNKELASLMTGKHVDHELLPFSFNGFVDFEKTGIQKGQSLTTLEKVKTISALERYLKLWSFTLAIKLEMHILQFSLEIS